jgi:hypothetical protein
METWSDSDAPIQTCVVAYQEEMLLPVQREIIFPPSPSAGVTEPQQLFALDLLLMIFVTYNVYASFLNATDHNDVRKFVSLYGTSTFLLFQLYFWEN